MPRTFATNEVIVGTLHYGHAGLQTSIDDRSLAHLQAVISAKLRRHEGFIFTCETEAVHGAPRRAFWISAEVPLVFEYAGDEQTPLNREWLEILSRSASSSNGLRLIAEPVAGSGN